MKQIADQWGNYNLLLSVFSGCDSLSDLLLVVNRLGTTCDNWPLVDLRFAWDNSWSNLDRRLNRLDFDGSGWIYEYGRLDDTLINDVARRRFLLINLTKNHVWVKSVIVNRVSDMVRHIVCIILMILIVLKINQVCVQSILIIYMVTMNVHGILESLNLTIFLQKEFVVLQHEFILLF